VYKIYSALEDSGGSGWVCEPGNSRDMACTTWTRWCGSQGAGGAALAIGSRVFSHRLTTCDEDFDDALMVLDFGDELIAQIQVTRITCRATAARRWCMREGMIAWVLPTKAAGSDGGGVRQPGCEGTDCAEDL